jgi:REP element-mobilizing transposase RayT
MPRKIIPLLTNEYYHIYNRGVDKRKIFETESDYIRFYATLRDFNIVEPVGSLRDVRKKVKKNDLQKLVEIKAYALLPNHFHLLVKQNRDGGVSEFLKRIQGGYTSHFNETYQRSGSLLQGTFKRVHVDTDEYYRYLFSYINENHSVHGVPMIKKIYHSSSLHYQKIIRSKVLENNDDLMMSYDVKNSILLAQDIYNRRKELKKFVFDE